jgi:hypothetical protein
MKDIQEDTKNEQDSQSKTEKNTPTTKPKLEASQYLISKYTTKLQQPK